MNILKLFGGLISTFSISSKGQIMSPPDQKNDAISDLGGFFKDNSIVLTTEELCKPVDLDQEPDDLLKQQALQKILNVEPFKIDYDSVEILREVREGRTQQVIDASKD